MSYLPENTMSITIHDTRGRLTAYGLSCGYIERKKIGFVSVTLWRERDCFLHARKNCYHVRAYNHDTENQVFLTSFDTLSAARRNYDNVQSLLIAIAPSAV